MKRVVEEKETGVKVCVSVCVTVILNAKLYIIISGDNHDLF
jgi:hypothetical protein